MRRLARCLALAAAWLPLGGAALAAPEALPTPETLPMPAAGPTEAEPGAAGACGAQAARYEGPKGVALFATRLGRAEVQNPLRPLTPEVTQVLQVTIAGKVATAYGENLAVLRRGGSPGALEGQLGGPIRWQAGLPVLPEAIDIVGEAGQPLARLAFRGCAAPPAVKAAPEAARRERKPAARKAGAAEPAPEPAEAATGSAPERPKPRPEPKPEPKTPPGFRLPQGAVPE